MSFKIGQKVVCVEDSPRMRRNSSRGTEILRGRIYTILSTEVLLDGYLTLEETGEDSWWSTQSFRPLDDDFADSVLSNIKQGIQEIKELEEYLLTPVKI